MNRLAFSLSCIFVVLASVVLASVVRGEDLVFEADVRPILRAHCLDCHGATDSPKGQLDLRQVRLMLRGGESGAAVVPGQPESSLLLQRIQSGEMPPGEGKVSAAEQRVLTEWIAGGARTARPEPETIPPGLGITPEERAFWSFQPIRRSEVPQVDVQRQNRVRTEIDAFLLDRMPEGLTFSEDADRRTLIFRAYFDLTGLPPTDEQLQQRMNDSAEEWYERLIDDLLQSPHYGERWARHWLDVAGYADSDGYTVNDTERAWTWKYRDYVIRSFNADKPFDRFITEQLAGDELAGPQNGDLTPEQVELLTATGYLRMAADGTGSGEDNPTARNQVIGDTLRIVSTSLLGLSVACAQCHDHRYDPIPQTDYYSLRAVFAPSLDWQNWRVPSQRLVSQYTQADREKAAAAAAEAAMISEERARKQAEYMAQALEKELQKYEEPLRTALRTAWQTEAGQRTAEQNDLLGKHPSVNISPGVLYQYLPDAAEDLKKYDARIAEAAGKRPAEEFLAVLTEPAGHLPETHLFHRGDFLQPQQVITPAALTAACPEDGRFEIPADDPNLPTSGRRLAFAGWLTSRQNPLVSRVIVNRIWLHHFGRGLVPTPADFGRLGIAPTHPELLDWLADEFQAQGWSVKHLHRLILRSTAWRQSSRRSSRQESLDPDNAWYSRQSLIRLDAELVRDRMLAVTGRLSDQLFGAPVAISEDDAGQVVVSDDETRRSIYIKVRRSQPVAMLQAFDAPVMEVNCERRPVSTVATQALMLMNSATALNHAAKLAARCRTEAVALAAEQLTALPQISVPSTATWQYGFGTLLADQQRIGNFTPFSHFADSRWQAGPILPDPALGYVLLNAAGGHPDQPGREVVRRWVAPESGTVTITGTLSHGSSSGDGVRGRILVTSSAQGTHTSAGEWTSLNNQVSSPAGPIPVSAGDQIDFVVDCLANHTSDSFSWPVVIECRRGDGASRTFDSAAAFRGPTDSPAVVAGQISRAWTLAYGRTPEPEELASAMRFLVQQIDFLTNYPGQLPSGVTETQQAMTDLCHVLLTSNEFLYVQ